MTYNSFSVPTSCLHPMRSCTCTPRRKRGHFTFSHSKSNCGDMDHLHMDHGGHMDHGHGDMDMGPQCSMNVSSPVPLSHATDPAT
jgi:hypothetical protein